MKKTQFQIEAYMSMSKSYIKGKSYETVFGVRALNDAPIENKVNGYAIQAGDFILFDTNIGNITEDDMYVINTDVFQYELVKIIKTEQGWVFHRTRDTFVHKDDDISPYILGRAFEVLKKPKI